MNGSKCQGMKIPDTASSEIFVSVWEVSIGAGDDKIIASAPAMGRDKIREDGELTVLAVGRAQEHETGIGK